MNRKIGRAASKIAAFTCALGVLSPTLLPTSAAHAQGTAAPTMAPANSPATGTARRPRTTPAEREAARAAREATRAERADRALRAALTRAGAVDAVTQDAVANYAKSEMVARQEAAEATDRVRQALRNSAVTDAQIGVLLNEMRTAAAQERTRRERTAAALDAQIGYTKKPRIEAVLMLTGLIGDQAAALNPVLLPMPAAGRARRATGDAANAPRVRRPRRNANAPATSPNATSTTSAMPAP